MSTSNVFHSLDEILLRRPKRSAVTIGVFDGVHRGHQEIIRRLMKYKESGRAEEVYLMTFDPHPLAITHSRMVPPILTTIDERLELLKGYKLDGVFVLEFDETIAGLDYRYFVEKYLVSAMKIEHLIIGYDFHLGKDREGNPERLSREGEKSGFGLEVVPPVKLGGAIISSTQIRNEIMEGRLARAIDLLGHPYVIGGRVVRGHGKGAGIGFPTANLSVGNPYKLWPSDGVYAVEVGMGGKIHAGMMNIGSSPTMKSLREGVREIEVNIFDFDDDIHGEELFVYCHAYMREEIKFPNSKLLVKQLEKDRENAMKLLALGKKEAAR